MKRDLEKEIIIPEPPSEYDRFAELIDIKSQYYNRVNPENMQTYLDESMEELFFSYIDKSGENIDKEYIVNLKKDIKPIIKNHKEATKDLTSVFKKLTHAWTHMRNEGEP